MKLDSHCPFCKVQLEYYGGNYLHFNCLYKYYYVESDRKNVFIYFHLNNKNYNFCLDYALNSGRYVEGAQLFEYSSHIYDKGPYSFTGIYIKKEYLENFAENIKLILAFS